MLTVYAAAHRELAKIAGIFDDIGDGVRGVHQQVEDHLINFAQMARHERQIAKLRVDLGDVFILIVGDDESASNCLIQVRRLLYSLIGMRKFLHRAHNCRDSPQSFDCAFDRQRDISP